MWTCEPRWINDCLFTAKWLILISTWISILTFVWNITELWITQTVPLRVQIFLSEAGERRIAPGIKKTWGEVGKEWEWEGGGGHPLPRLLIFRICSQLCSLLVFFWKRRIQKQKPTQRRMIFWRCTIFRLLTTIDANNTEHWITGTKDSKDYLNMIIYYRVLYIKGSSEHLQRAFKSR